MSDEHIERAENFPRTNGDWLDVLAERDRLKESNAALAKALELILGDYNAVADALGKLGDTVGVDGSEELGEMRARVNSARAALSQHTEGKD